MKVYKQTSYAIMSLVGSIIFLGLFTFEYEPMITAYAAKFNPFYLNIASLSLGVVFMLIFMTIVTDKDF